MNGQKAIEKALSLVGQGYIYGAKGQKCSQKFREGQAAQYPEQAENILGEGAKWDGMPVWDCAQLTRAVAREGDETLVSGATSQWKKTNWKEAGEMATMPDGKALFLYRRKTGSTTTMQHTGFALGDGTVVHARGTAYGVVRQNVADYPWTHWAMLEDDANVNPPHPSPSATPFPQGEGSGGGEDNKGGMNMLYEARVNAASGGTVNIRTAASANASRVERVPVFATVKVLEEGDGWHRVQYEGYTGWMMAQYLTRVTDENNDTVSINLTKEAARALKAALDKMNL